MNYHLLVGDCLEVMRTLPSGSVQCCVTSPPYYGLRDYQTGTWEGGDPNCDHKPSSTPALRGLASSTLLGGKKTTASRQSGFKAKCSRCGAIRIDHQIGLEETPEAYVAKLVEVFREVRRLLKDNGTLWLNLGDSYNGSGGAGGDYGPGGVKEGQPRFPGRNIAGLGPKQLLGIPWRVAFALQDDGWVLRADVIWAKKAPMPESVADRPTKAHEYLFLLAKNPHYFYDAAAIREPASAGYNGSSFTKGKTAAAREHMAPVGQGERQNQDGAMGRNKRSVWLLGPERYHEAHFATMPTKLVEPCILAGSRRGDTVLDPFNGSGTTGAVALKHGRHYIGIDLNPAYIELAHKRIQQSQPMLLVASP